MAKRRVILWVLAAAGVVGFGFGLLRLLLLRFEAGDIYPPYSSLRTDPLGTKALYQALAELPRTSVRRNFLPLRKLSGRKGATLLYLGASPAALGFFLPAENRAATVKAKNEDRGEKEDSGESPWLAETDLEGLAEFVSAGGRLVISFSPEANLAGIDLAMAPLMRKFGFGVGSDDEAGGEMIARPGGSAGGEAEGVSWHTPWYFKGLSPQWRKVYLRGRKPVIIERKFKAGSVVLCTDTYFLSNEAMLKERRPRLLAWLVGGREILFDETHLGVVQQPGVATLAREYNLAGLFFVLVLLAGLFVWKNAATFLPRSRARAEQLSGAGVEGQGSGAGLVNLLRKSISARNVLAICLNEWTRSAGSDSARLRKARERIESAVKAEQGRTGRQRDPVAAYRSICRVLSERKG